MRIYVLHSLIILIYVSSIHCKDGHLHKSLIPFPRVGRSRQMPSRGLLPSSWSLDGYQGLREGKRHLIPFPRVGKRQSLIPFPRVGKSFHEPEEFDDDVAIDDTFPMPYPTGGEGKQLNESPMRPIMEYDIDTKNVVPVGAVRHQGMLFIPQWLLNQDEQ